MSGTYSYCKTSKRAARRNRRRTKAPFKPANTGKPRRTRGAGTRSHK